MPDRKKLWPEVVEGGNTVLPLEHEYSQITEMAHTIGGEGFEDLDEADVLEILTDKELDENDLVDMVNGTNTRESDPNEEESGPVGFTAKVICEGLESGRKLGNPSVRNDPNVELALLFQREINKCLTRCEDDYKDLTKNQTPLLITDFFTKVQGSEIACYSSNNESELHQLHNRVMTVTSQSSEKKKQRFYESDSSK